MWWWQHTNYLSSTYVDCPFCGGKGDSSTPSSCASSRRRLHPWCHLLDHIAAVKPSTVYIMLRFDGHGFDHYRSYPSWSFAHSTQCTTEYGRGCIRRKEMTFGWLASWYQSKETAATNLDFSSSTKTQPKCWVEMSMVWRNGTDQMGQRNKINDSI